MTPSPLSPLSPSPPSPSLPPAQGFPVGSGSILERPVVNATGILVFQEALVTESAHTVFLLLLIQLVSA